MLRSKIVNQLFKQLYEKPIKSDYIDRVARTHNSTFAIGWVKCSADSVVVADVKFCAPYKVQWYKSRPSQICKPLSVML